MQELLFDITPVTPAAHCRTCAFRVAYHYPGTVISYCQKQKSKLTANHLKKIKAKDPACPLYQQREKQIKQEIQ